MFHVRSSVPDWVIRISLVLLSEAIELDFSIQTRKLLNTFYRG